MPTSVSDNEPPSLAALTERERQMVQLICKGLSNKQVAHLLNKEARARLIAHLAQAAATGAAIESGAFLMRFFERV